jgi:hypothetical protein
MRTLVAASASVKISIDIDTHPETWGTRQSDQYDVFRVITCPAGTWPVSLNSTLLPPSEHLDAYAFTCLWLQKLASVTENMPHTYFKQYFLPLLPENILHDNDPVMLLALRIYRRQSTIPPPSWHDNIKPRKSSADYVNFQDWTSFVAAAPQAYQVDLYLEINATWLLRTELQRVICMSRCAWRNCPLLPMLCPKTTFTNYIPTYCA